MSKKKKKNNKKWMRLRHRVVTALLRGPIALYCRWKYRVKIEPFREKEKRPYIILFNHQTPFDQFFVSSSIKQVIYYLASEDIFSNGWVSSLIRWVVAPVPIRKQTTDVTAVMTLMRIAREGGSIAMAPEGNRTYSGRTEHINPAIAPLVKKLGIPLVLYRIEGGYGTQPRWSDVVRKGPMRAYVSKVVEPEQLSKMSNDEIACLIRNELMVDECTVDHSYRSKKNAEYLERMVFLCPDCGPAEWKSEGDLVTCTKCGKQVRYLPSKELEGVHTPFPFRFTREWYDYQKDFINQLDPMQYVDQPLFRDTARLSEVIVYKKKVQLADSVSIALFGNRIEMVEPESVRIFSFDDTSAVTVLGRNKLNIYFDDHIYQLKGDKRMNALKYVFLYNRYRNVAGGNPEETFLGL